MKTKYNFCERIIVYEFVLYNDEMRGNIRKENMFKHGGAYADQL